MIWVFDKQLHIVPDEGNLCSGYYYEKAKYRSNVVSGVGDIGFLGHGSLFLDIMHHKTPYNTILTDNITDQNDLLYLIEPWPDFNGLMEKEGLEGIKHPLCWNRVLDFIPRKIVNLATLKRLTILLHIPEWTSNYEIVKENINKTVDNLKIPRSQFKFIGGVKDPDIYFWPGFEYSQMLNVMGEPRTKPIVTKRKKKFTFLNRIDKTHRRYAALQLWREGLHKQGYFSYSFKKFTYEGMVDAPWDDEPWDFSTDWDIAYWEWKKFYDEKPWTADELTWEEHNHHWHIERQHYEDAYWNFVTETGITNGTFLSEKTFKPISQHQPFIILGNHKSLALLRDLGYKTFSPYIDESYDEIESSTARIKSASNLCVKLAQMTHKEHIRLTKKIQPILDHNQRHFFSSKNRIENFVKYIYGNNPAYDWLNDCKYD